jgi:RNA polymerase sigma-70 factor (ECF subfamily)
MLRLARGDRAAFDELVRRNTPKVHALVFRFLGDVRQIEDLTQEVFLRIYRTAPRYQPTAKFSTWLYRITANLSFNVLRDRRKANIWQLDSETNDGEGFHRDVPDTRAAAPQSNLHDTELAQQLAAAISQLPENQRIAIVLNKYEDKGYQEIADVLEISTMAVKSLLSRARENLRQSLAKYLEIKD